MRSSPLVTILMPVHNGEWFLNDAVLSILNQTWQDYEFLIINDGSTDNSRKILSSFSDNRLHVVDMPHQGLISTMNQGIQLARGEFIAIMHCDDIAMPTRVEKQVNFLSKHLEIGILGTAYTVVNEQGCYIKTIYPPFFDLTIRWTSLLASPFGHPTVMMRRQVIIDKGMSYLNTFDIVEDFELWSRLLPLTHAANLKEPLLKYRVQKNSRTGKYPQIQLEQNDAIANRYLHQELPDYNISLDQVTLLRKLFVTGGETAQDLIKQRIELANLYLDLLEAFASRHAGQAGLRAVKRMAALQVLYSMLSQPSQHELLWIFTRLMQIIPELPVLYCLEQMRWGFRRIRRSSV